VQFELTDIQEDMQKAARKFAEKEFDSDLALELDREGKFPKALFEKACQLGFVGIDYPEEFGGQSLGLLENVLVTEEFCKKDSGMGTAMGLGDLASGIILRHGSEGQKKSGLVPVTQGKAINTVAVMDPVEGPAKAEATDSGYVLTGKKTFVINAPFADTLVVFCEVHPAPDPKSVRSAALIVDKKQEGVKILERKKTMGLWMASVNDISFDRVKVPKDRVIGDPGKGAEILNAFLVEQRIKMAAQAVGIAQDAFTRAVRQSNEREQFGRKICQFQGIQFMFADLYTQIEAARGLVYRAACSYDTKSSDLERLSSVAKIFATDMAVKTALDSIQIHGGGGLMREYSIERMFRDAKTIQNLIETNLVGRAWLGKAVSTL
jgi:alkylation response protein AidB-like acyl-CoA dehydrogenase